MIDFNYYDISYLDDAMFEIDVPNAGRKLVTLPKRLEWNAEFDKFVVSLENKKPVIICGDMNVAHQEIGKKIRIQQRN